MTKNLNQRIEDRKTIMIKDLKKEKIRMIRGSEIFPWMLNKQIILLILIVLFVHVFQN